jgi:hypothetical protein
MDRISKIGLHGFILATAVAMFIHSTWTINTIFGGQQPTDGNLLKYLFWVIPGALVAFAIDIGQIATSMRLRHAHGWKTVGLAVTFITLAIGGYYLQWFHIIHHMPVLPYGAGISAETQAIIRGWRDAAIFIGPALMPISTILYTISNIGIPESVPSEAIEAAPLVLNRPLDFLTTWTRQALRKPAELPVPVLTHSNGTANGVMKNSPGQQRSDGDSVLPGAE